MNEAQRASVEKLLITAFKDIQIAPEEVQSVEAQASTIDFPRSLYCKCRRCTSQYREVSVLGYDVTLRTADGEYHGWMPGPEDAFEHV